MKVKSNKKITWLQLSDLHIFASTEWNLMLGQYKNLAKKFSPDFIVITGDFRHKKNKDSMDFEFALKFLNEIIKIFNVKKKDVFLVPGNHDVNDYEYRKETINTIIKDVENKPDVYMEYTSNKRINKAFSEYKEFVKKFYGNEVSGDRVECPEEVYCVSWKNKINIVGINTSLISDGERTHKEITDVNSISNIAINENMPTIVLGHHNIESLYESHKKLLISMFDSNPVRAYLCGDAHKKGIKIMQKHEIANKTIPCIVCGKSTVESGDNYSDVGVIEYSWEEDGYVYVKPYNWSKQYEFKKADDFTRNIDEDFRFFMLDAAKNDRKESLKEKKNRKVGKDVEKNSKTNIMSAQVYSDITEAHKDIANDIREGGFLKFYGLRGATFIGTSEVNSIVKELKNNKNLQVKFLVSYPLSEEIRHRLKNMDEFFDNDKCEEKWRDTYRKVNDLQQTYKNFKNISVRFHDTPLIFRLIFTKQHLYLGYYEPNKNSINTEIFRFDSDSPTYNTYNAFFDSQWLKARHSVPSKLPPKYSFLKEKFSVQPSLVINTTSLCNFNCLYCPTGGENLCNISQENHLKDTDFKRIILAFKKHVVRDKGETILRITGGEPLVDQENYNKVAMIFNCAKDYNKIVLCTNGINLKRAYSLHSRDWDLVKKNLLLKISVDTLDPNIFSEITGTGSNGKELFKELIDNIDFANRKGFKIELNLVATKENVRKPEDILNVFEFARKHRLVGVKVLTVNDFGGEVTFDQNKKAQAHINRIIGEVIKILREQELEEKDVYLYDNKGIQMRRFISVMDNDEKCTLTIVDHNNDLASITPRRTFSDFCRGCKYFLESDEVTKGSVKPCATGIMSLTLRTDGLLSPCRLRQEKGVNIKNITQANRMDRIVREAMKAFDNCYHMNMRG